MNETYYYACAGEDPRGPVTLAALRAAVDAGEIPVTVEVSRTGMAPWRRLDKLTGVQRVGPAGMPVKRAVGSLHKAESTSSLAPLLIVLAWIEGLGGALAAAVVMMNDGGIALSAAILAGSVGAAAVFAGLAEALRRLAELGEDLRRRG